MLGREFNKTAAEDARPFQQVRTYIYLTACLQHLPGRGSCSREGGGSAQSRVERGGRFRSPVYNKLLSTPRNCKKYGLISIKFGGAKNYMISCILQGTIVHELTVYIGLILSCLVVLPIWKEVDHVHLLLGEGLLEQHVAFDRNIGIKLRSIRSQNVQPSLFVSEQPALRQIFALLHFLFLSTEKVCTF